MTVKYILQNEVILLLLQQNRIREYCLRFHSLDCYKLGTGETKQKYRSKKEMMSQRSDKERKKFSKNKQIWQDYFQWEQRGKRVIKGNPWNGWNWQGSEITHLFLTNSPMSKNFLRLNLFPPSLLASFLEREMRVFVIYSTTIVSCGE
ncbi:hypothetical protein CIPAW_05G243900 [Carya illinoinensis]|uniref:Uncharacterized protein n=1 Tax=Carya illinoinensis TaxID=32201 RepID=A0A8T1QNY9_CARIL|nr:hypothetical protein CIPAW_05G243900 [Carya illinoinensis]